MVNFTNGFTFPRKNSVKANREASFITRSQIDLYKQDTCSVVEQSLPMQQQTTQLYELPGLQNDSSVVQPKPSPSWMDADSQFNFPNYLDKSSSHVMTEQCEQSPAYGHTAPVLERQYSINTIMEVIDSHDINDITSPNVNKSEMQTYATLQSQPINIQRPGPTPKERNFEDQFLDRSNENQQVTGTVLAPPASDMREFKHGDLSYGSSISSSPGGFQVPFTQYQETFIQQSSPNPSSTTSDMQNFVNYQNQNEFTPDVCSTISYQPAEDQMSPFQPGLSPYQYEMQESPALTTGDNVGNENNDVFTFDNVAGQFKPSQSCPNINAFPNQRYSTQSTSSENVFPAYDSEYVVPPPPYAASVASDTTVPNAFNMADSKQFQLEEVDHKILRDDIVSMSEQERLDQKRIRNNLACRASRERRKKRKAETEALADHLENKNRQLKEKIKQLEAAVKQTHAIVRERMNQS